MNDTVGIDDTGHPVSCPARKARILDRDLRGRTSSRPAERVPRQKAGPMTASCRNVQSVRKTTCQSREHARQSLVEFGSLIAAIGEQLFQERKHSEQVRHDQNAAIAILNIVRMDDGMKQQAQRIYENVPLLALNSGCGTIRQLGSMGLKPPWP